MTAPTYLQFHLAVLLPAMALLVATAVASRPRVPTAVRRLGASRRYWSGVGLITVVAMVYTAPWDTHLIAKGVWWYGEGSTLTTVGHAPVGGDLFIAVGPWLTALWLSHLSVPNGWPTVTRPLRSRVVATGVAVALGVAGWGWGWGLLGADTTFYVGATLAWAAPVLALQWAVGAPRLWARRRLVALGVLVPTTYLCVADRVAIEYGIWILSERYTTGLAIAGLPVGEAVVFLVTNGVVVRGPVLYRWVSDRHADTVGVGVTPVDVETR
jgi:lycopene cyclase domain-containing protein